VIGRCMAVFDRATPALVLKLGHYPLHHGGLGVIRSLGRMGVPVFGVHEDRFTPAAVSTYLRGRFLWRTTGRGGELLMAGMAAIGEELGRPTVLVTTDDLGAIFVAEHAASLERWFLFPRPPAGLPRVLASKQGLHRLCRELGVPSPAAAFPESMAEAAEFVARATFPLVVKRATAEPLPSGVTVPSTTIARTPAEVLDLCRRLPVGVGIGLMLQEYIPRGSGEDWIFHGYCDERSDCIVGFTGVKLRSYPAYAGPTTLGRCADNPELREQSQALFKTLSYRGVMDLDYRLDRRDGQYKLLDFNPRVGAQFRLFEDSAGIDVVRALHLDLTGRTVPRGHLAEGRRFVVENNDLLASWGYRRDGGLTVRAWLRSLRGVQELAWFAADDPAPFLAIAVRFLLRGLQRALRVGRPRAVDGSPRYLPGRFRPSWVARAHRG
jgi:D-aspartate ligase